MAGVWWYQRLYGWCELLYFWQYGGLNLYYWVSLCLYLPALFLFSYGEENVSFIAEEFIYASR